MMMDLAAHGLDTVRTFQVYAVGARGILTSRSAREISPEYLANVIHFLRTAQATENVCHLHLGFMAAGL